MKEMKKEKESKPCCDICLKNKAEYYRPKDEERLSRLILWGLFNHMRKRGKFDKPRPLRIVQWHWPLVIF